MYANNKNEVNELLYSEGKSENNIGYPFYAFHIYVIDRVFNELFPNINTFEKAKEVLQQRNIDVPVILSSVKTNTPINIIFVFGSIGTGKSTITYLIKEYLKSRDLEVVLKERIDFDSEEIFNLGRLTSTISAFRSKFNEFETTIVFCAKIPETSRSEATNNLNLFIIN